MREGKDYGLSGQSSWGGSSFVGPGGTMAGKPKTREQLTLYFPHPHTKGTDLRTRTEFPRLLDRLRALSFAPSELPWQWLSRNEISVSGWSSLNIGGRAGAVEVRSQPRLQVTCKTSSCPFKDARGAGALMPNWNWKVKQGRGVSRFRVLFKLFWVGVEGDLFALGNILLLIPTLFSRRLK